MSLGSFFAGLCEIFFNGTNGDNRANVNIRRTRPKIDIFVGV